jgi:hypothetical protein
MCHRSFSWEVGTRSFEFSRWVGVHTSTLGCIGWKCWGHALFGGAVCSCRPALFWYTGSSSNSLGLSQGTCSSCTSFAFGKKLCLEKLFEVNEDCNYLWAAWRPVTWGSFLLFMETDWYHCAHVTPFLAYLLITQCDKVGISKSLHT